MKFVLVFLSGTFFFLVKAEEPPRVIHAYVSLCDNASQGIIPVPSKLGNGDDPANNLYWGAMYGLKAFFKRSPNWEKVNCSNPGNIRLQRCIFKHKKKNVFLVADAYRGQGQRKTLTEFLEASAGMVGEIQSISYKGKSYNLKLKGASQVIVFVGHNGLMDLKLPKYPRNHAENKREVIILSCISKRYFKEAIRLSGAYPLLWTTGLMAPEAYTLEAILHSWVMGETREQQRNRAASAYAKYQKCSLKAAKRLLVSGY